MTNESEWNYLCCRHISLFVVRYGANVQTAAAAKFDTRAANKLCISALPGV